MQQPMFGVASPHTPFAPRPQQSALASTPVLNAQINEEETQAIRYVSPFLAQRRNVSRVKVLFHPCEQHTILCHLQGSSR